MKMLLEYEKEAMLKTPEQVKNFILCEEGIKKSQGKCYSSLQNCRLEAYKNVLDKYKQVKSNSFAKRKPSVQKNLLASEKYIQLVKSAEKRGIEFDLTLTDVKKLLNKSYCEYSGVKMVKRKFEDDVSDYDLTIDRLDSSKGYVVGNVFSVCHRVNWIKNQLTELNDYKEFSSSECLTKTFNNIWRLANGNDN